MPSRGVRPAFGTLVSATIEAIAKFGYAQAKVGRIVGRAGVRCLSNQAIRASGCRPEKL